MEKSEIDATLTQLKGYFPRLGTRLDESPQLLADAIRALRPYEQQDVETAIRRLAFATLLHPSLDRILEMADVVREEQKQARARQRPQGLPQPVAKTLHARMQEWAATPHDPVELFWAQRHVRMVLNGSATHPRARARQYQEMMTECPVLETACTRQIELCHRGENDGRTQEPL